MRARFRTWLMILGSLGIASTAMALSWNVGNPTLRVDQLLDAGTASPFNSDPEDISLERTDYLTCTASATGAFSNVGSLQPQTATQVWDAGLGVPLTGNFVNTPSVSAIVVNVDAGSIVVAWEITSSARYLRVVDTNAGDGGTVVCSDNQKGNAFH